MNSSIPAGIEQYLKEAGFSATEMLILTKIVEENALTLRELAGKTGKSTGVLDQAMRKLMQRKIVERKVLNGGPKFVLRSLDAILEWAREDLRQRRGEMDRKYENFEQYIGSLKVDGKRPDIEYFFGAEGIEGAYMKLTESGQEFLTITPITTTIEDDPLRECRVNLFRRRQYRKIFQRVLAPDGTLARRFQSRDMFEYRKTLLLPPSECTTHVELTVVGDTVACVDLQEQKGCLIHFADLAKVERENFEVQWARQLARDKGESTCEPVLVTPSQKVGLRTKISSALRIFLLKPTSILSVAFFAFLSASLTFGLYSYSREINLQRIRETVTSIASTGALQIQAEDIKEIQSIDDVKKPVYAKIIALLNLIRRDNPQIVYVYLIRPTQNPSLFHFIADADADPYDVTKKVDTNHDGILSDADEIGLPGLEYNVSEKDVLIDKNYLRPIANKAPYTEWGSFVTGYAPIFGKDGSIEGVLAVDMWADKISEFTLKTFSPLLVFLCLFLVFLMVRFWALNRSLLSEILLCIRRNLRYSLLIVIFLSLLTIVILYGIRQLMEYYEINEMGKRLMAIATTAVDDFDPVDLDQLHIAGDMKKDAYQRVFKQLNAIRNKNPSVTYAYFVRPTNDPLMFEFVADADANWNLPQYFPYSINKKPLNNEAEENIHPGVMYYGPTEEGSFIHGINYPSYIYAGVDQWGTAITGLAPLIVHGKTKAILCLDYKLN